jgi:molybdate transport system substrate-binding protein
MTMFQRAAFVALAKLGFAIAALQAMTAQAAEIKVLSTTLMHSIIGEAAPAFERATGHKLSVTYDTTNLLMGRINGGETADVVILTTPAIEDLSKRGKVAGDSRVNVARSGIGIAVLASAPKPDVSTVEAFKKTLLAAKSVAYTTSGASGLYFQGLCERLGIADAIKAKARTQPGGATAELVVKGEAEIAVQQIGELLAIPGVQVQPLPAEINSVTPFSAGLFAGAKGSRGRQGVPQVPHLGPRRLGHQGQRHGAGVIKLPSPPCCRAHQARTRSGRRP